MWGKLVFLGTAVLGIADIAHAADNPYCRENYDSQALLIGNKVYRQTFEVPYALNDVAAMKKFLVDRLCYRKGNIKVLPNATYNDMREWLGTASNPRGRLWLRTKKGRSNVFVYYSGHGVPDATTKKAYLLTVDTRPDNAQFGFGLNLLDDNLRALNNFIGPRRSVTLLLDACFSGRSARGALQSHSGAIRPKLPSDREIIRFTAAGAGQLAYWNEKRKLGLFTSVFLDGVAGAADGPNKGNRDGKVTGRELTAYIADEVSYRARSMLGKEQTPTVPDGAYVPWEISVTSKSPDRDAEERAKALQERLESERRLRREAERREAIARERVRQQELERQRLEAEKRAEEEQRRLEARRRAEEERRRDSTYESRCIANVASNDSLNVRWGAGRNYGIAGSIPHDACDVRVSRTECDGQWCRVDYRGLRGWINTKYTRLPGARRTGLIEHCVTNVASYDTLNIRSRPSSRARKSGEIGYRACGVMVDRNRCRGWWCFSRYRGMQGWLHTRYLRER